MSSSSRHQLQRKIKSIIPTKTVVDSKYSYYQFLKKGYRILPDVKIAFGNDKYCRDKTYFNQPQRSQPNTLGLFKSLKFAQKFDFTMLKMHSGREFCWEKRMLVAKRMSNSCSVSIGDLTSLLVQWTRCMKRAKTFHYQFEYGKLTSSPNDTTDYSIYSSTYARFLKYMSSSLKNLTLHLPEHHPYSTSDREKFKLEHFPATLERLSIKNVHDTNITLTSLAHLKNLKHFEVAFDKHNTYPFAISTLDLLLPLASHLQSLSIKWPVNSLDPIPKWMKSLKNLTKLRLEIPSVFQPNNLLDLQNTLEAFEECPLNHLDLNLSMSSEKLLPPISNFIAKNPNLKSLKLFIYSPVPFPNLEPAQKIFDHIDNLPLLTRLSVTISMIARTRDQRLPEFRPLFTKIFSKPIPLETFKIKLYPFEISNQGFLKLLKSLEPRVLTLNKIKLDIGLFTPAKNELVTVFKFIKSLKNIRSLKIDSIGIANKQALTELVEAVCSLKYLTVLRIGEVKGTAKRPAFVESLERVLQKRGLRKLDCRAAYSFATALEKGKKNNDNPCIDQVKIEKRNPSICHFPILPIFTVQDSDRW